MNKKITARLTPDRVLALVQESLDDDKAEDVVVIDLSGKSSIADFMVIASGTSSRHVSAMTDHVVESLKKNGVKGVTCEGQARGDWVLVDSGDVIVHLFRPEVREFYNLEKLWSYEMPETASMPRNAGTGTGAAHTA